MGDWIQHTGWFCFGGLVMFVLLMGMGPVMLSSIISEQERRNGRGE